MSRRDIIIIAALVNAGLLAVLFMMAINSDEEKINESTEVVAQPIVLDVKPTDSITEIKDVTASVIPATPTIADEVDLALKEFAANPTHPVVEHAEQNPYDDQDDDLASQPAVDEKKPVATEVAVETKEEPKPEPKATDTKYVEITVKRGDSLDKIARANGTTISSIKEINQLKNDKLKIGQVLKVLPSSKKEKKSIDTAKAKKATETAPEKNIAENETQYYTIKSGDNPWKIAKQFHIKVDEFLELNHLDEEKARNLKVGEKVRVK